MTYAGPELLAGEHLLSGFDCGSGALNDWLGRRALRNQTSGTSRTWVVVEVETRKLHPIYRRMIRRTTRVKAHDEASACEIGDLVRLEQTRPLSKEKHWRVAEILERSKVAGPVE